MHRLPCAFSAPRMLTSCARFCGLMRPQPRASLPLALIRHPWARPSEPPSPDSPEPHFARDLTLEGRRPIRAATGALPAFPEAEATRPSPFWSNSRGGPERVPPYRVCEASFYRFLAGADSFIFGKKESTRSPFSPSLHASAPSRVRPRFLQAQTRAVFATRTAMRPTSVCQPKLP